VKTSHILLVLGALLTFAPSISALQQDTIDDSILIQIDDHIITTRDIEEMGMRLTHMSPDIDENAIAGAAVSRLIQQALFMHAAQSMQLPLDVFETATNDHIADEIQRLGSYELFLEAKKQELSIDNVNAYHDFILNDFVKSQVLSVVTGQNPTKNKGFLILPEPSPAEIRRAYKENESYRQSPAILKWNYLRFMPSRNDKQSPAERALQATDSFNNKEISVGQLIALADSKISREGVSEDSAEWVSSFLKTAKNHDVLVRPATASGVVAVLLAVESMPATIYDFKTAQPSIRKDLMRKSRGEAIDKFFVDTASAVDVWVSDEVPGLKAFVSQIIGRDIPANNSAEL
jgi:hypothetical protein